MQRAAICLAGLDAKLVALGPVDHVVPDGDTVRFVDPTDRLRRQAPPLRASRATMTREQFVAQLCGHAGLQFIASS